MLKISLLLVLNICIVILQISQADCSTYEYVATIATTFGRIRGRSERTMMEDKLYFAFRGIPYAQPPLGRLRFLPPLPPKPWNHTIDCFEYGNICPQKWAGNEDCLFLNVFTPDLNPTTPLAVMFYIHGGAWYNGHGAYVGPDFLLNENVVVVTINYRLGALGFLSLGTPEYSGNQGLKDQLAAMQWVAANIDRFGGDPSCVTLFGDSAGSMSARYHMWAPASRGLFHRSIEISFSFDVWSIVAKKDNFADALRFAEQQNVTVIDTPQLIDFLQRVDKKTIIDGFPFKFYKNIIMPTIEPPTARWPLTTASPSQLMFETDNSRTNIDVMTGWTTGEALFLSGEKPIMVKDFLAQTKLQLPSIHFNFAYDSDEYLEVSKKILQFYHPNAADDELTDVLRIKSDITIRYFVDRRIKLLAEKSTGRTYYYRFGAETKLNYYKSALGFKGGASHGDDICYFSPCNFSSKSLEVYKNLSRYSDEYRLIRLMAGMYADFAKYGHPFVDAKGNPIYLDAVRPGRYSFVDITNEGAIMGGQDPFREESAFWDQLFADHPNLLNFSL